MYRVWIEILFLCWLDICYSTQSEACLNRHFQVFKKCHSRLSCTSCQLHSGQEARVRTKTAFRILPASGRTPPRTLNTRVASTCFVGHAPSMTTSRFRCMAIRAWRFRWIINDHGVNCASMITWKESAYFLSLNQWIIPVWPTKMYNEEHTHMHCRHWH